MNELDAMKLVSSKWNDFFYCEILHKNSIIEKLRKYLRLSRWKQKYDMHETTMCNPEASRRCHNSKRKIWCMSDEHYFPFFPYYDGELGTKVHVQWGNHVRYLLSVCLSVCTFEAECLDWRNFVQEINESITSQIMNDYHNYYNPLRLTGVINKDKQ